MLGADSQYVRECQRVISSLFSAPSRLISEVAHEADNRLWVWALLGLVTWARQIRRKDAPGEGGDSFGQIQMTNRWGPTGVVDIQPFELEEATRNLITVQLKALGVRKVPDEFLAELNQAISIFRAGQVVHESSRPAEVRRNLESCLKAVNNLEQTMKSLDGNSRRLLFRREGAASSDQLDETLPIFKADLAAALKHAENYPKAGRLFESARLFLAIDVAKAFSAHLNLQATATKEGKYESILAIVLQAATGQEARHVHDLACRAVAELQSGG
jgi:hypothetical protein